MTINIVFKKINVYEDDSVLYFGVATNYKNIINGIIGYRYFDNAVYNNIPKIELIRLISDSVHQFNQVYEEIDNYEVSIEIRSRVTLKYLIDKKCIEIITYNDSKTYLYSLVNIKLDTLINERIILNAPNYDSPLDSWFKHIDTFPEEIFETGTNLNFFPILSNYNSRLYRMYYGIVTDE